MTEHWDRFCLKIIPCEQKKINTLEVKEALLKLILHVIVVVLLHFMGQLATVLTPTSSSGRDRENERFGRRAVAKSH